jgi:hypothetical protein
VACGERCRILLANDDKQGISEARADERRRQDILRSTALRNSARKGRHLRIVRDPDDPPRK